MAKSDMKLTNNSDAINKVLKAAKKIVSTSDTKNTKLIDKVDEIVTVLQTKGANNQQGKKAEKRGNPKDYDDAVKRI